MPPLLKLDDNQVEEVAQKASVGEQTTINGTIVAPDTVDAESMQKVEDRLTVLKKEKADINPPPAAEIAPDPGDPRIQTLPGGVEHPGDGWVHVGTVDYNQEMDSFAVLNLLEKTAVDNPHDGLASVTIDVNPNLATQGIVRIRLINDGYARIYVFRKDDAETKTTTFRVGFGHN